jgi:ATP-dependent Clp protease ATP-binding subunit ClpA
MATGKRTGRKSTECKSHYRRPETGGRTGRKKWRLWKSGRDPLWKNKGTGSRSTEITAQMESSTDKRLLKEEVDAEDIAENVAKATGIPVAKMLQSEREKLLNLEDELHKG